MISLSVVYQTFHVQGLKGDGSAPAPELAIVQPHVAYIVQFITVVAQVSIQFLSLFVQADHHN